MWRAKNEYNLNTMAAVNLKIGILETAIEEDATDAFINGKTENPDDLDELAVNFLETELLEEDYDVTFLHLKSIDSAGHRFGYGPHVPEYMKAVM